MKQPSDGEDRAFWAFFVVSHVWASTDRMWWLSFIWLALCILVRAPYWFKRGE